MPPIAEPAMRLAPPDAATLGGLLGEAVEANRKGRLSHFITDERSPAIALFAPEVVAGDEEGDWYGEHAGKWLVAATRAAVRAGDDALLGRVLRVADYLIERQDADGYLGNYAPSRRFMVPQPPKPVTWDGAPALRTWDIWTHSYLVLGLVELWKAVGDERYRDAAARIGDLCWRTLTEGGIAITDLGNHFGLSATVLLDPAVELFFATDEERYLDLARLVVAQAESEPHNRLLSAALAGADPSEIATGKAYQLLWNLVGLAKLNRATGEQRYLAAVRNIWQAVRSHHLTLGGGPWGGVAHRSREVFNPAGVFSPEAYVETCSTMAWIQLNRELLTILGDAAFAQEIERSAYNDLLGAQAPDGEDWCYYSFPNGRRIHTTYWRCCKSSGAIALEELPAIAYGVTVDGAIAINLLGESSAKITLPEAGVVQLRQQTAYPFDGPIAIEVTPVSPAHFAVDVRIPNWAEYATLRVGDETIVAIPGRYARIERDWAPGDVITLDVPMPVRVHHATQHNVQESLAPGNVPVAQEVMHYDFVAVSRGPLAYATGLVDGFKRSETVRFAGAPVAVADGDTIRLEPAGRASIVFEPWYRAGGRQDGAWRLTWLGLAEGDA
ncbi:glycoside hydrolase family 127 protein [Sphingomonas sp. QA11]|uniref:glycoside hydrolase family 127 protein n=1 Tax=Sphingomonas sp. QA11 TaxID=2950605 RepID=UPI00234A012A|nr:beta-L-arabinofuranosidase domain-containing protein [Sphingomonas sp. QA11]WCM25031.1 glycoside hydrolase family 127 protein [Sphingomonas sp. QA11]